MTLVDWIIMAVYFALSVSAGLFFAKRAGRNTEEFFLGGRKFPWWLAGLSMVATTFAADTPLAVTELVATRGVAGNWLWWNMAIGGMLTVFFFARQWRRSGVMTDLEIIELRYSGRPAAFLRGFRSVYLGLFMNAVIMGWVNVAMATILRGMFGISEEHVLFYVGGAMFFTALYSSVSGLWGVAVTDAVQFGIAMIGCIVLAVLVVQSPAVGGIGGLHSALPAHTFDVLPRIGSVTEGVTGVLTLSAGAFIAYIGIQWWASWYPGAEPGGGGYIAQRMMSTKDERHAVFSVLFFQVAHYCLRPWPWILVGLSSLVLYPDLSVADKKLGYIYAMNDFLPAGLKGLLVAAFFAAYMSTIATHLNWGTSYLVHDLWRRFVRPGRDERHYVRTSRLTTLLLMLLSLLLTFFIDSISSAWQFIIECGAGLGLVLLLRWYWWRVNAWSEIVATIAPAVAYTAIVLHNAFVPEQAAIGFPTSLFLIVGITTFSWLLVTLLTRPTDADVLSSFFRRVRPGGVWGPISLRNADVVPGERIAPRLLSWLLGIVLIYSVLFLVSAFLFGGSGEVLLWLLVTCASAVALWILLRTQDTWTDRDLTV
ncbi:MAG: Na+:solute symporter [Bacteroidia bacterium]|nr:Na+:solute symporter [Bacteroidia bacterium]